MTPDGETHVLEASGHWTNDRSSTASVHCFHPRCTYYANGVVNEDAWPGYDWDDYEPLAKIVSEAQASHDAWLRDRSSPSPSVPVESREQPSHEREA